MSMENKVDILKLQGTKDELLNPVKAENKEATPKRGTGRNARIRKRARAKAAAKS
jgi:hypothetical protein